jgi:hypothetical protein
MSPGAGSIYIYMYPWNNFAAASYDSKRTIDLQLVTRRCHPRKQVEDCGFRAFLENRNPGTPRLKAGEAAAVLRSIQAVRRLSTALRCLPDSEERDASLSAIGSFRTRASQFWREKQPRGPDSSTGSTFPSPASESSTHLSRPRLRPSCVDVPLSPGRSDALRGGDRKRAQ